MPRHLDRHRSRWRGGGGRRRNLRLAYSHAQAAGRGEEGPARRSRRLRQAPQADATRGISPAGTVIGTVGGPRRYVEQRRAMSLSILKRFNKAPDGEVGPAPLFLSEQADDQSGRQGRIQRHQVVLQSRRVQIGRLQHLWHWRLICNRIGAVWQNHLPVGGDR